MQELINEIRKLIEYAGQGETITKEAVDMLSIKKLESVIFDLTDTLGKKDTKKALEVLQNLIYQKEPPEKPEKITRQKYLKQTATGFCAEITQV